MWNNMGSLKASTVKDNVSFQALRVFHKRVSPDTGDKKKYGQGAWTLVQYGAELSSH